MSHTDSNETDKQPIFVDAKGLKCPMPVIKLQQQVRKSHAKDIIKIACTDPGAEKDVGSWVRVNKHHMLEIEKTDYGLDITIQVKDA